MAAEAILPSDGANEPVSSMLFEEEYEEPLGRDESYTTVSVEEEITRMPMPGCSICTDSAGSTSLMESDG